jgi:methionyl-tRNA formyltransferase
VTRPGWVVFAYHTFGARALRALLGRGERILAVVTHEDDPAEGSWFDSVAALARSVGLPVLTPRSPNTAETRDALAALAPDVFLSVWYRRLLAAELLRIPRIAALNLHGSLLPAYRGRAPVNWVIVNGERRTGVTLHHMTVEADAGDIVAQRAIDIGADDTAATLYARLVDAGVELLVDWYPAILAGTAPRVRQDQASASFYGRRRPEDGRIAWTWPATRIVDMIRAVTHPYPGAFVGDDGDRVWLWAGTVERADDAGATPGTLLDVRPGHGITVATGRGAVLLSSVQGDGCAEERADDWARRRRLVPGARL